MDRRSRGTTVRSRRPFPPRRLPEPSRIRQHEVEDTEKVSDTAPPAPERGGAGVPKEGGGATQPDIFDGAAPVERWHWPTKGKVIGSFGKSGRKGIHLAGSYEQPVVAAAAGRVVYSGAGLVGYGRLIVLKHNKHFFSAYAHNSKILVKEGEVVKGGQRIALMGSSGSDKVKLHFEIRRDGKPVDPLRYLPRQRS